MQYIKKIFMKNEIGNAHISFNKEGIVFFDRMLPDSVLDSAIRYVEPLIASTNDTEKLVNLHLKDAWFADFVSRKEFTDIAAGLLGVTKVKIFSSMILNKPAYGLMTVPWHQDAAYEWPLDPVDCASLWLAFDDVTVENGAMEVAIGGHKVGKLPMEYENVDNKTDDKLFSTQLKKAIPHSALRQFPLANVTMNKGQASFHHSMLPHSSKPNLTNSRRCAFIVRYCRGDAVLNKYPGMPREEYFKNFVLFEPKSEK